jgi:hypothetical protein
MCDCSRKVSFFSFYFLRPSETHVTVKKEYTRLKR